MSKATKTERNAEILRRYTAGETAAHLADEYDLTEKRIYAILKNERRRGKLTMRVVNILERLGIDPGDIDAIAALSEAKLVRQPGMGAGSLETLRAYLHSYGRSFRERPTPDFLQSKVESAHARWQEAVRACNEAIEAERMARAAWQRALEQAIK